MIVSLSLSLSLSTYMHKYVYIRMYISSVPYTYRFVLISCDVYPLIYVVCVYAYTENVHATMPLLGVL